MTLPAILENDTTVAATEEGYVVIAATFIADELSAPISHLMSTVGLSLGVQLAPYNQVFQELLTPNSTFYSNPQGVNVLLLRLADSIRDLPPSRDPVKHIENYSNELLEAITSYRQRVNTPTVVAILRASPGIEGQFDRVIEEVGKTLQESISKIVGFSILNSVEIAKLHEGDVFDAESDRFAHIPFTTRFFSELAVVLTRRVNMFKMAPKKVLVLDCDNTLWGGVVGEDGVDGLQIREPFLSVQRYAVSVQSRGVLICLASKNEEQDVWSVFDRRPEMILQAPHIVAHRVNWEEKSSNLRSLARQLNLGLDSFVFLDDNPVECGMMRENLPELVTLQLPESDKVNDFLDNLWVFDRASITAEDARRTEMYHENAARDTLEAETRDIGDFIASLQIVVKISPPEEVEWARVAQLMNRTNQFNFTTLRRSETELRSVAEQGAIIRAVHVQDRFGDYGLVGVVVAHETDALLEVDNLLLSCRVLGRGVEYRIISYLGHLAEDRNLTHVRLVYRQTEKNTPARAFANSIALDYRTGSDGACDYMIPARIAAEAQHRPGEDAIEVIEARNNDRNKSIKSVSAPTWRSGDYERVALELYKGESLLQSLRATTVVDHHDEMRASPPSKSTEGRLIALWENVLNVAGLGIDDDFFEAGGTSLLGVRLFAEIEREFKVRLPLTTIISAPCVRLLAQQIESQGQAEVQRLVSIRTGGSQHLFLVHDGDGETLLYRTLAHLLPTNVSVTGIQPSRRQNIPLVHTRIEEMATCYLNELLAKQPQGPYLLGGLCAGGLIAYEMARQIQLQGGIVDSVLLLDAATPQAAIRKGLITSDRMTRFSSAIAAARSQRNPLIVASEIIKIFSRKCINFMLYEIKHRLRAASVKIRIRLLLRLLKNHRPWPSIVPTLSFRDIYKVAENAYRPIPAAVPAILFRARNGTGNDRPYVEIFEDPTFGWSEVTQRLIVVDVDGGHSTMLQEPYVSDLSQKIAEYMTRK